MRIRVEESGDIDRVRVYVETVGIIRIGQEIEKISHAAAHIQNHIRRLRAGGIDHCPANLMRREELSHFLFPFGFGVFEIGGKITLFECMKSAMAGIGVVYGFGGEFRRVGTDGRQNLFIGRTSGGLRHFLCLNPVHTEIVYGLYDNSDSRIAEDRSKKLVPCISSYCIARKSAKASH